MSVQYVNVFASNDSLPFVARVRNSRNSTSFCGTWLRNVVSGSTSRPLSMTDMCAFDNGELSCCCFP